MAEIKWGVPPERQVTTRVADWQDIARQLRDKPQEWGCVLEQDPEGRPRSNLAAIASSVRRGSRQAFRPAGHYEARSVQERELWLRYTGGNPQNVPQTAPEWAYEAPLHTDDVQ